MSGIYLKVFVDSLEKYRKLNDAEFGRLMRAALRYKATGEVVELMGREELLLDGIMLDIDRDNEKYNSTSKARSESGRKGAATRWNGKCHFEHGKNGQDKDEDKDEDKDKDKDEKDLKHTVTADAAKSVFRPPTLEEVEQYCRERKNGIDPAYFVDFYTAKGWMVGKNKMKNWKAAVRTWERNQNEGMFNSATYQPRDAPPGGQFERKIGIKL